MTEAIVIYVEGGGDPKDKYKRQTLRLGFKRFLGDIAKIAYDRDVRLDIVPRGGRDETYRAFMEALSADPDFVNLLLLDAEAPVVSPPWQHIAAHRGKGWPLTEAHDAMCHLMVQAMEAWLVADPEALAQFYGEGFDAAKLPAPDGSIEGIPPRELSVALRRATRKTTRPERYHKIRHAPDILSRLDAERVRHACPHCDRLFTTLTDVLDQTH
jgi:hypothetical protein